MTTPEPHASRRRPRREAVGIRQLPWRRLINPYRPVEIVSVDQVEAVHVASLRILAEIGMEVLGDRALDALAGAGARVDRATRMVRIDPAQVETLVAMAPHEFRLHARNPDRDVVLGGSNLVFCAVGGPAFVSDLDRGRRPGNFADFVDYVRLIGALDVLHQEGGGPPGRAADAGPADRGGPGRLRGPPQARDRGGLTGRGIRRGPPGGPSVRVVQPDHARRHSRS